MVKLIHTPMLEFMNTLILDLVGALVLELSGALILKSINTLMLELMHKGLRLPMTFRYTPVRRVGEGLLMVLISFCLEFWRVCNRAMVDTLEV